MAPKKKGCLWLCVKLQIKFLEQDLRKRVKDGAFQNSSLGQELGMRHLAIRKTYSFIAAVLRHVLKHSSGEVMSFSNRPAFRQALGDPDPNNREILLRPRYRTRGCNRRAEE